MTVEENNSPHEFTIRSVSGIWYVGKREQEGETISEAMNEWKAITGSVCHRAFYDRVSGNHLGDLYEIDSSAPLLGQGQYGLVYPGFNRKTNEKVAIKAINVYGCRVRELMAEMLPKKLGNHPGIVKVFDIQEHTEYNRLIKENQTFILIVLERLHCELVPFFSLIFVTCSYCSFPNFFC